MYSTDEYETDTHHPPSDDDSTNLPFLSSGLLPRSPTVVATNHGGARGAGEIRRSSPRRRCSPRRRRVVHSNTNTTTGNNSCTKRTKSSSVAVSSSQTKKKTKSCDNDNDSYYAGDDDDSTTEQPSRQTPKYEIGTQFTKRFDDGHVYCGTITEYHRKEKLYSILYEDGDMEDLEEGEIDELMSKIRDGADDDDDCSAKNQFQPKNTNSDSEEEEDSDEDPFSHLGKTTTKRRKMITYSDDDSDSEASSVEFRGKNKKNGSSSSFNNKKKKKMVDDSSEESSSDELFRAKTPKVVPKRMVEVDDDDDDDSDSDIELLVSSTNQAKRTSPARRRSPRKSPSNRNKITNNPLLQKKKSPSKSTLATATTLDSINNTQLRAQSCEALEQSKRAREALRAAQGYHAEDVEVPSPQCPVATSTRRVYNIDEDDSEDDLEPMVVAPPKPSMGPKAIIYSGSTLRLTLRYKDTTNNKNVEKILRIKSDEPLRFLKERFQGSGSIVSLKFDGQTLDVNKTPQFYEMEDEDLLDAVVQSSSMTTHGSVASTNDVIKLSIRKSGTTLSHEFGMPNTAPLSKLMDGVCAKLKVSSVVLRYNGNDLDPAKTCKALGIPNNAIIDAVTGKTISLEFRVNGNSKDVHTVHTMENGTFQHAMEAFATKRKCSLAGCKFLFDGEVLRGNTTMESLDLEGDEIIDVELTAAAANPPPLKDSDGDVIMANAAPVVISVKTVRNVSLSYDSDALLKANET